MRRPVVPAVLLALALPAALAGVLAGCTVVDDDPHQARPTVTVTASPTPRALPVPATVPVGEGSVGPGDVVWAQGSELHVGSRTVDLAPAVVQALVVVPGQVLVLDAGALWATDLSHLRSARVDGVTRLRTDTDAQVVEVVARDGLGGTAVHAWSTVTGAQVPTAGFRAASRATRLGRVDDRGGHVGTGGYAVRAVAHQPLSAYAEGTGTAVPLSGTTGDGFRLVRWTSGTTFYGLTLVDGRPSTVLGCDLTARRCTTWGRLDPDQPVVVDEPS